MPSKPKTASLSKDTMRRLYDFLIAAGKVAGGVTFIFGIGFGIYQFYSAIQDKKVEQTIAMYRQFTTSPVSDYRARIIKANESHRDQVLKAVANEQALLAAVEQKIKDAEIQADLVLMLNFYDGLLTCGASALCDRSTANDLFYPRATEMYMDYYQYMLSRRRTDQNFGCGLEKIALKDWKSGPCD